MSRIRFSNATAFCAHRHTKGCSNPVPARPQVFEVTTAVAQDYRQLQEVALFLSQPTDPIAALGLYISVGGAEWQYRGYVSNSHPSGALDAESSRSSRLLRCYVLKP